MPHRIVIVGGGAGGLELATRLGRTLGKRKRASIVLVDATMAGLPDWHDPWWQEKTAAYRIVIADTTPDDAEAFAALQTGCFGYCQAAAPLETLRQVLEVVSEGGLWAGQGLVQRLLGAINQLPLGKPGPDLLESLSAREREVVHLASRGLVNKLIARELGITERTVRFFMTNARRKLNVVSNAQAVAQAGPDDIVLVAGKGHEPYQEIHGVKHPFDDTAVARHALEDRQ